MPVEGQQNLGMFSTPITYTFGILWVFTWCLLMFSLVPTLGELTIMPCVMLRHETNKSYDIHTALHASRTVWLWLCLLKGRHSQRIS